MKWLKKVDNTPLTAIAKVIDSLQTQTNDRINAPSIHAVREAINNNWLTIYPIGSIYMSVNNVDPSTVFGGTWQQIKDRFLLACGDTYNNGATGGEATHTLNVFEMPVHNHGYVKATAVEDHVLTINEIPTHSHNYSDGTTYIKTQPEVDYTIGTTKVEPITDINIVQEQGTTDTVGGGLAHGHGLTKENTTTASTGQTNAHNNMPPYLAVNVWVRTA